MNCPDCGRRMRRDDLRPGGFDGFVCDNPACAKAAGGGAWRDREAMVRWVNNYKDPVAPPPDWTDWVARVRQRFGNDIILVFVAREGGRWHVGTAELPPKLQPGPPAHLAPDEVSRDVTEFLRAAGKPVD